MPIAPKELMHINAQTADLGDDRSATVIVSISKSQRHHGLSMSAACSLFDGVMTMTNYI